MGRRAVDTTISLIVSVFLVSVMMYFLVYSVFNVPVTSNQKRDVAEGAGDAATTGANTSAEPAELPLCPRKPEFFSESLIRFRFRFVSFRFVRSFVRSIVRFVR